MQPFIWLNGLPADAYGSPGSFLCRCTSLFHIALPNHCQIIPLSIVWYYVQPLTQPATTAGEQNPWSPSTPLKMQRVDCNIFFFSLLYLKMGAVAGILSNVFLKELKFVLNGVNNLLLCLSIASLGRQSLHFFLLVCASMLLCFSCTTSIFHFCCLCGSNLKLQSKERSAGRRLAPHDSPPSPVERYRLTGFQVMVHELSE